MQKVHRSKAGWRNLIAALLAAYYLLCIFCLYAAFFFSAACGLIWERRLMGKENKDKV